MQIVSTYSVRINERGQVLRDTAERYRAAVDFYIEIIIEHWGKCFEQGMGTKCIRQAEILSVATAKRPFTKYDFSASFYKFPSYLRRAAIQEAYGHVSSYQTRLALWQSNGRQGKEPGKPTAGRTFPAMYRNNMFVRNGRYCARIKVFIRNTWDWIEVGLRKCDVDYISLNCAARKECVPTLCCRGKVWSLDFSFIEEKELTKTDLEHRIVLGVDLGLNNACVCSAMHSDGTVIGRAFLKLPKEKDSLKQALGRIRKAQKQGARKMPRLWARAKGLNDDIAVKTANFILETAHKFKADVIVMERLELNRKIRGSNKQKLHHWKARYVQRMVEDKAHRCGKRFSRVCAWNTSRLAFDGSGSVERDAKNYSLCTFKSGKRYHCDLSASYNIAARYFIREKLKSSAERLRQRLLAKVPECAHRSTCTLCSLIRLCAALGSQETQVAEQSRCGAEAVLPSTNGGSPLRQ